MTSPADPPPVRYAVDRRGVEGFLAAWHALGGTSERVATPADLGPPDPGVVLVHATAAVAQTGSVVVDSRRNARAASLLPERAVFVVDVATIVETPGDFGRMGGAPSHPELLDWLAATFRDDMGGSLKSLHRLIVTSAAYRQRSDLADPVAESQDRDNRLLWRANARKLEAEAVRDAVLAVSGSLNLAMGGPGYRDFVIEQPEHSPHYRYDLADPEDRGTWRRSVYRFIVRSQTQPFMTCLDCADPSMRVEKRNESLSALQSLALLNNGFMLVQSRRFAERVAREAGADPAAQVERAFWLAIGRPPEAEERETLVPLVATHGLANACRVIFNLNEFAFVD